MKTIFLRDTQPFPPKSLHQPFLCGFYFFPQAHPLLFFSRTDPDVFIFIAFYQRRYSCMPLILYLAHAFYIQKALDIATGTDKAARNLLEKNYIVTGSREYWETGEDRKRERACVSIVAGQS